MSSPAPTLFDRPNNFDAIRLSAAVAVILAHAYPLAQPGATDPIYRWSRGRTGLGGLSVYVFFAISGYLITMSCDRSRSRRTYLTRRVRRLYPGFAISLALCFFVIAPLAMRDANAYRLPRAAVKWIAYSICLNEYVDANAFSTNAFPGAINGSLWTIKYEFACYLVILAIAIAGGLRKRRTILFGTTGAILLAHVARTCHLLTLNEFHLAFVRVTPSEMLGWASTFLAGGICWIERSRIRYRPAVAIGVLGLLVSALFLRIAAPFDCLLPIGLPYVVLTVAYARCSLTEGFATRVRGDYSYGTYLYAFPIQQFITAGFGGAMSPLLNFAIATPLALLCGVASWHLIEKRFVRRERREAVTTIVPADATSTALRC